MKVIRDLIKNAELSVAHVRQSSARRREPACSDTQAELIAPVRKSVILDGESEQRKHFQSNKPTSVFLPVLLCPENVPRQICSSLFYPVLANKIYVYSYNISSRTL